jgi:hypothetical protein
MRVVVAVSRVPKKRSKPKEWGRSEAGLRGSVAEEAVHREGRCAASGEAPDRSVPAAVR